jgi:hypothetical protein
MLQNQGRTDNGQNMCSVKRSHPKPDRDSPQVRGILEVAYVISIPSFQE